MKNIVINSHLLIYLGIKEIPNHIKYYNRYQIIGLTKSKIDNKTISEFTGCSMKIVKTWCKRSNITDKARSGRPVIYNEDMQLKIIAFYCQVNPLPGCGRWTLR